MSIVKENKLFKNKKIMAILGIIFIVIVIVCIVIVSNNGTTRYAKKMKSYLEKVGYNCDGVYKYEDGYFDTEGKYIYCQMTTSNGIYKEVKITKNFKDANGIGYKESVNGIYSISIQGQDYASKMRKGIIRYNDELEKHTFRYYAPNGDTFNIGDRVNCDNESNKYKEFCEDDANDVNLAMREFESYFSGAGIKLK